MSTFNLRFRRKKLFTVLGLALGLLAMPLLQSSQAAGINLDMAYASRLVDGAGSPTDFSGNTAVQQGNAVQFAVLVHNTDDAVNGQTAKDVKVRIVVPKTTGTSNTSTASVTSSNAGSAAPYRGSESTTLTSANGKAFNLTNVGGFYLQRNNVAPTNNPTFNFTAPEAIPLDRVKAEDTGDSFVFTVTPNAGGDLGPCFQNAVRILFLADVQQGPEVTINKEVRKVGETTYVKENTAKRGDTLEYRLSVKNNGPGRANEVVIRDSLPPGVTLVSGSCRILLGANPLANCPDDITNGGLKSPYMEAGSTIFIKIQAKVGESIPCTVTWVKNTVNVSAVNTGAAFESAKTNLPCAVTPTPTPTMTPTPTPTPTVQPQAGGLVIVKYEDKNGNASQENGEGPLANVTFTICGPEEASSSDEDASPVPTATPVATSSPDASDEADASAENCRDEVTNADGKIVLNGIDPGTYTVTEQVPSGFRVTTASTQNVTVVNNSTAEVKFGNQRLTSPTPTPPVTREEKEAPPAEQLPKTGTPIAAALATIGIASSGYLYRRERMKLNEAMNDSNIVS